MSNDDKHRILVVDDTPLNIELLKGLLEDEYDIQEAPNGIIALKLAQSTPHPDLILLDVMMPGMDGFEVCRELKANQSTKEIPVIFVTADTNAESVTRGFQEGGVDYVTKPFNSSELQERISTHISLKLAREKLEELSRKLGKYLSPTVYDSIFHGEKDVKIESYRKVLTVCFTDIVNFTQTAEGMDHRGLTDWLNGYLNEMADITLYYGGTLDKFMGDAVMIFFGDPTTTGVETDALKCIDMAKAMVNKARELGIDLRVGISTGMCTIGNFGSDDRMDYTVLGKEVNLASRLEKNSEPGRILISENTWELIKEEHPCTQSGEISMKGIEREIGTYWLDES